MCPARRPSKKRAFRWQTALADWENAYRDDPLADVATALDNFAPSPELEETLLLAWLDDESDPQLRDRLAQVRAPTRIYYAAVLFSASALAPRDRPDANLSALNSAQFKVA